MCKEVDGCGAILPAANISGFYAKWHAEKSQKHMESFSVFTKYIYWRWYRNV